jgi:NUMOD3 motif
MVTHFHHIIPRHAGGSDGPDNLVQLTVEDHAIAHRVRFRIYGDAKDYIAWLGLSGQIDRQTAIKLAQRLPKSDRWKKKMSIRNTGAGNPFYGKKQSDYQKEAVRKANSVPKPHLRKLYQERYAAGEHKVPVMVVKDNPKSRSCIIDGILYDTQTEAARVLGVNITTLRHRLNSPNKRFVDWNHE